jgi:SnoaL-like protein
VIGTRFVEALAARDAAALAELLHPEIDFRAVTPGRAWEAQDSDAVMEVLLGNWIEESDRVDGLSVEDDTFMDRRRLRYSMQGSNDDGPFAFEQQAYLTERDGKIDWIRIVCSGFRPLAQTGSE